MRRLLLFLILIALVPSKIFASEAAQLYLSGMEAYDNGDFRRSIRLFRRLLKQHDKVSDLGRVQYQIGRAYEEMGRYKRAFRAYETIFKKYPNVKAPEDIIDRQFQLAEKFASGEMRTILGIDFAESEKTALEMYEAVVRNSPFGTHAETAMIRMIRLHLKRRAFDQALEKIGDFKRTYDQSEFLDEVYYLEGMHYYNQRRGTGYDQKHTLLAIEKFEIYLATFPSGNFHGKVLDLVSELTDQISRHRYQTAEFYRTGGNRDAARRYWNEIVENYPDSKYAEKALHHLKLDAVGTVVAPSP